MVCCWLQIRDQKKKLLLLHAWRKVLLESKPKEKTIALAWRKVLLESKQVMEIIYLSTFTPFSLPTWMWNIAIKGEKKSLHQGQIGLGYQSANDHGNSLYHWKLSTISCSICSCSLSKNDMLLNIVEGSVHF